jgi:DNA adenine methylase
MPKVKPILKWIGGKSQILDLVLSKFPRVINDYYEPFIGGASVVLGLLQDTGIIVTGKVTVSDSNKKLIYFYKNVQSNPKSLKSELLKLIEDYESLKDTFVLIDRRPECYAFALTSQESYYYYIRKFYNELDDYKSVQASAMFLFLNKTCFRGMYREGPNGFNVPFGNYNSVLHCSDGIEEFSRVVRHVEFKHCDFNDILKLNVKSDDFMYLDPPYVTLKPNSFVGYTRDGFDKECNTTLFNSVKDLMCRWLMSNSSSKIVLDIFQEYNVTPVSCKRAINSMNPESRAIEVLITQVNKTEF